MAQIPRQILQKYWGFSSFWPMQEEIILSVLTGRDTLALLPTGGGKSVCYQVPGIMMPGLTLVISPLIALMADQVNALKKKGIFAAAIFSGMTATEMSVAIDNALFGNLKFLYLSPERLETDLIRVNLPRMKVNILAVDEAHCISQWGYDFRPPYLKIAEVRRLAPSATILALTATATLDVAEDIQNKLLFRKKHVIKSSFIRKNLSYSVLYEEDKLKRIKAIPGKIKGSGIIYVRSRKKTREIAGILNKSGISSELYHAGLSTADRMKKQASWMSGAKRVMIATNAFGMGIDKPDVRFVIHYDPPDCLESYFQEAGRAGRDGKKSWAVLLFGPEDQENLTRQVQDAFPELKTIRQIYDALGNYLQIAAGSGRDAIFTFHLVDFARQYGFQPLIVFNTLKILERDGYIMLHDYTESESKIMIRASREDIYKYQVEAPAHEPFIKTLLRSYPGLFSDFQKISESDLARRLGMSVADVRNILLRLSGMELLEYIPKRTDPSLVFITERIDARDISLTPGNYRLRKESALERLRSMILYATSQVNCRSQMLLSYFGETDSKRCGICDICLKRNRIELSDLDFEYISGQILPRLARSPMTLEQITEILPGIHEDKIIKAVQWLMDNDRLKYRDKKLFVNQLFP
ncbi:MAG: RecQ family ATP-dependent DNA helicase [Bacteroidales bacterium]|nr:RecQ family ATP-dependent DNA helicase [Bacteroidales bacterium]